MVGSRFALIVCFLSLGGLEPRSIYAQEPQFLHSCRVAARIKDLDLSRPVGKDSFGVLLKGRSSLNTVLALVEAAQSVAGLPDGEPCAWYEQVLEKLHGLELCSVEITDLSSLESLSQLEELTLSSNNIADISPLGALSNLKSLDISGNQISDIGALSKLNKLVELRAMSNQIVDVSALQDLSALRVVWLSNNRIKSVAPLEKLNAQLHLENNAIEDIRALSGITLLNVNGNNIKTLKDYKPSISVALDISNNPVAADHSSLDQFLQENRLRNGEDKYNAFYFNLRWMEAPFSPPIQPNSSAYIDRSRTVIACSILGTEAQDQNAPSYWPVCAAILKITGLRHLNP